MVYSLFDELWHNGCPHPILHSDSGGFRGFQDFHRNPFENAAPYLIVLEIKILHI